MGNREDLASRSARAGAPALAAVLLALSGSVVAADIYRYQDVYGNWHFTDEPPAGVAADIIPDIKTGSRRDGPSPRAADDLAARLEAAFDAITPVAQASLAVVAVRGPGGTGSGFFCNARGDILTERRLLQGGRDVLGTSPAPSAELVGLEEEVKAARDRLAAMEKDLEGYERVLKNAEDATARAWAEASHAELDARYQAEREALVAREQELATLADELGVGAVSPGGAPLSEAGVTKLDLYLKDGTALSARVVEEDAELGVALLRLDGYRTPSLALDPEAGLAEGLRVFVVGRAIGLQDAVTSGTLTQVNRHELLTDAEPLPGQGGAAVIDEAGRVIGIASTRGEGGAAQGRAIPAILIRQRLPGACR
ncbi:MAG: serine protease [Chromatiaceae bacterium]|jgi:S1-C subfamily serine protease|nr:serine protease [Chromatiaceae bacterium]